MQKLRALLIDDEESASNVLSNLLLRFCPEVEVVGICKSVEEGVDHIHKAQPDLVFLDIEMPNYAGFEIVQFFEQIDFEIIFVTAYDNYAVQAFEIAAIDYLLKPVDIERLKSAVARTQEKRDLQEQAQRLKLLRQSLESKTIKNIVIADKGQQHIISIDSIYAIEAQESYCTIYTFDKSIVASKNLKYFETNLSDFNNFIRVHKSWIVNIHFLQNYSKSRLIIQLNNGLQAKLSKYKKAEFESLIKG